MTKGNTIVTISHDRTSRGKDIIKRSNVGTFLESEKG